MFETFNIFDSFRLKIVKFNRFQFSYRTLYYCQEEARLIFFFFFFNRNNEGFICAAEQSFHSDVSNFPRIPELQSCEIITKVKKNKRIKGIPTSLVLKLHSSFCIFKLKEATSDAVNNPDY